jgi:cytochrome c-type biogenesis protein CcmF
MNIYSTGENVILGRLGHAFIIIAFVAALASALAYAFAARKRNEPSEAGLWVALARKAFIVHGISVFGIVSMLLFLIHGHFFEYKYVWQHSSRELPFKYILSSFWEGQEGSTLLWMFWHVVLGFVLIFRSKQYEAPVLSMLSLVQFFLTSMLLGIYVLGYKMGSNPFMLLKDAMDLPIFQMNPNFVPEDGSGLNPLLQNYWMVIHPPVLFLGFAATTIPFCFAFGGLWFRDYDGWTKPVMPWALFALALLGTGILMGGAWAYEALSFGGFWAWDPVENASLVPWLLLVAGVHALLAYRHTGYSLFMSFVFFISSFLLILYSSFLTKSGVLGDSSVHSFTDMGMSGQLVVTMLAFVIPGIAMLILRYREIPGGPKKEEAIWSREFWLFVGALVFLFSAIHIIVVTSFPVFNRYLNTNLAPPSDIERHYNSIQIWIAVLAGFGSGFVQYLRYKDSTISSVLKKLMVPFLLALLVAMLTIFFFELHYPDYVFLAVASWFAIFANIQYIIQPLKGKLRNAGGSLAHIGIGLMLAGILISQARQEVISVNRFGINYGGGFTEKDNEENILLYQGKPELMKNFWQVTYLGDSLSRPSIFYKVRFEKLNEDGSVKRTFVLTPNILLNDKMGNSPNPSTHRSLVRDLYTHITMAPLKEDGSLPDSLVVEKGTYALGDTIFASRCFAVFESINADPVVDGLDKQPGDIALGARLRVVTNAGLSQNIEPVYYIRDLKAASIPADIEEPETRFYISKILPQEGKIEITTEQPLERFIILKAIIFPMINLLWLGSLIMVAGIFVSMRKRIGDMKRPANVS